MRKTALTLLLVFAAFIWSCDDEIDERASFGTAYVSVTSLDSMIDVDLIGGTTVTDNSDPAAPVEKCVKTILIDSGEQPFLFFITPNPISTSGIGFINIKQVKISFTGITDFYGTPPIINDVTLNTHIPLHNADFDPFSDAYQISVDVPLFNEENLQVLANYVTGNKSAKYEVTFKFKLIELATGIEEELKDRVIVQAMDNIWLPEGQCTEYLLLP
jgi:hypothetical protein